MRWYSGSDLLITCLKVRHRADGSDLELLGFCVGHEMLCQHALHGLSAGIVQLGKERHGEAVIQCPSQAIGASRSSYVLQSP